MAASSLGIIAGGGPLPGLIARACRGEGREVLVIAFEGETDPETCAGVPTAGSGSARSAPCSRR